MSFYYCPVCGACSSVYRYRSECPDCHTVSTTMDSKHDWDYYTDQAIKLYNDKNKSSQVFLESEVYPNPHYNHNIRQQMISGFFDRCASKSEYDFEPPSPPAPIPRCPTCQSTNIKKISFAKGYLHWRMLGFFSKTAMSQWECKSCGTKF